MHLWQNLSCAKSNVCCIFKTLRDLNMGSVCAPYLDKVMYLIALFVI